MSQCRRQQGSQADCLLLCEDGVVQLLTSRLVLPQQQQEGEERAQDGSVRTV